MPRPTRPLHVAGCVLGLLVLILAAPALAQAARYTAPSGSGTACTQASPCDFQTAISGAAAGDDVNVIGNQGDYALGGNIVTSAGTPIHIHGVDGRPRLIFATGG